MEPTDAAANDPAALLFSSILRQNEDNDQPGTSIREQRQGDDRRAENAAVTGSHRRGGIGGVGGAQDEGDNPL
ncbi:hypothetical protein THAOC_04604, partial [Thalassiosira oceanica]